MKIGVFLLGVSSIILTGPFIYLTVFLRCPKKSFTAYCIGEYIVVKAYKNSVY